MIDDTPIPLTEAAKRYPGATAETLRYEASRGRLRIFKVGRSQFTTIKDLRAMEEEKCRASERRQGSGSTQAGDNGLSETERLSSARAATENVVKMLKSNSLNTSAGNGSRRRAMTP